MGYIQFCETASKRLPIWGWVLYLILSLTTLVFTLTGNIPAPIARNPWLAITIIVAVFFFLLNIGAYKLWQEEHRKVNTLLSSMETKHDEENEKRVRELEEVIEKKALAVMSANMMPIKVETIVAQSGCTEVDINGALKRLSVRNQVHYWNGRWGLGPPPKLNH